MELHFIYSYSQRVKAWCPEPVVCGCATVYCPALRTLSLGVVGGQERETPVAQVLGAELSALGREPEAPR